MNEHDCVLLPETMIKNPYGDGIRDHRVPVIHQTQHVYSVGRFAMALVERWGLVACEFDGEDSAGRQKLRRLSSQELCKEACNTAEAMWKEFGERGWLLEIPLPTKMTKEQKEKAEAL